MGMYDGDNSGEGLGMLAICVFTFRYGPLLAGIVAITILELDPDKGTL